MVCDTFAFFAYISVLVVQGAGRTPLKAGITVSAFSLTAFVASSQSGRLVDRFAHFPNMAGGFLLMSCGSLMMGVSATYHAILVGSLLFGVGGGVTAPVQKSLVTQLSPLSVRAGSVSASNVFKGVGQTAGPFLMGVSLQFVTVQTAFVVFGVVGGGLGAGAMVLASRYRRAESG